MNGPLGNEPGPTVCQFSNHNTLWIVIFFGSPTWSVLFLIAGGLVHVWSIELDFDDQFKEGLHAAIDIPANIFISIYGGYLYDMKQYEILLHNLKEQLEANGLKYNQDTVQEKSKYMMYLFDPGDLEKSPM